MTNLNASTYGKKEIEKAIAARGISKTNEKWLEEIERAGATISMSTWRRFYSGAKVRAENFKACCKTLELDWQTIREQPSVVPSQIFSEPTFNFGKLETTWLVKDGTGEQAYERENIICHYQREPLTLPASLSRAKQKIEKEQEERRIQGIRPVFSNGHRYYLHQFVISRTERQEKPQLHFWFGPSDYFTYLATNQRLGDESLRRQYIPTEWDRPIPFFSNAFAIYLCVITEDNYLILTQRSRDVGSRPGEFNISANEGLSRDLDQLGNAPDVYSCAIRGLKEELEINRRISEIELLSFGVDTHLAHWALLGMTKTNQTKNDIIKARSRGVHDKWENTGIDFVPFHLDAVIKYVYLVQPWAPAALACIYHCLVRSFGRSECDTALQRSY